jgi:hypothetical protein
MIPMLVWGFVLAFLLRRRRQAICPDAVVSNEFLQMHTVLRSDRNWRDLSKRRGLLRNLEAAAASIEVGLPRRLRSGDPASDLWLQQRATGMAASLRELKRWVATPREDTREILLQRIRADLLQVALGNWDALQESDSRHISLRARAGLVARDLVVAVLPLCAVLGFSRFLFWWKPALAETHVLTGLLFACAVWLIYRVIVVLDPRLTIEDVKFLDFLSVPGWGKKKG